MFLIIWTFLLRYFCQFPYFTAEILKLTPELQWSLFQRYIIYNNISHSNEESNATQKSRSSSFSLWKYSRDTARPIMKIVYIYLHNLAGREQLRRSFWFMWHCAVPYKCVLLLLVPRLEGCFSRVKNQRWKRRTLETCSSCIILLVHKFALIMVRGHNIFAASGKHTFSSCITYPRKGVISYRTMYQFY